MDCDLSLLFTRLPASYVEGHFISNRDTAIRIPRNLNKANTEPIF